MAILCFGSRPAVGSSSIITEGSPSIACARHKRCFIPPDIAPIFLLLSTHVKDPIRDQRVIARNKAVTAIGEKYVLPVVDLYSLTKANAHLLAPDGVHWVEEGYVKIARELLDRVKEAIR